jgi:hypothetical protein
VLGVCTHLGCVLIGEAGDYGGWVSYCICDADFRVLTAFSPLYVHSVFLSRSLVLPLPVSIELNLLLILSETDFVLGTRDLKEFGCLEIVLKQWEAVGSSIDGSLK